MKRLALAAFLLAAASGLGLADEPPIDYERYGTFKNPGTSEYAYEIADATGLAAAAGEGVYPNRSAEEDPGYKSFIAAHGGPDEGTQHFYRADALYRLGRLHQALKAYHAIVVYFPRTAVWSADGSFYWHAAPEAIARIRKICAIHPELGIQLEGAVVEVIRASKNPMGGDPRLDDVRTTPGRFVPAALIKKDVSALRIVEERGGTDVKAVKFENGHWQLLKDGKPFVVKGVTYVCTTIGESAHAINLRPWMTLDDDRNGQNDGMFDSWVDANGNNRRDSAEKAVGDAELLRRAGINAIRYYHNQDALGRYEPAEYDKPLMRRLASEYGITFIMGDFLGAYTIGSGAAWGDGTDYLDPEQRRRMLKAVESMVLDHRDEPYVLMWLLGNENQHPASHTNAGEHAEEYARFANEAALLIKKLDPKHPVAVGHLNFHGLREMRDHAPDVDIYGANAYSGDFSMGSTLQLTRHYYDRPLLFTEWGSDAYYKDRGPDEEGQARTIEANWKDMELNMAGNTGEGNVIGGVLFEWMDEWWKTTRGDGWGNPNRQDTEADFPLPFADGWAHEEWYGLMSQGDGSQSHFLRRPRKSYDTLRRLWGAPDAAGAG